MILSPNTPRRVFMSGKEAPPNPRFTTKIQFDGPLAHRMSLKIKTEEQGGREEMQDLTPQKQPNLRQRSENKYSFSRNPLHVPPKPHRYSLSKYANWSPYQFKKEPRLHFADKKPTSREKSVDRMMGSPTHNRLSFADKKSQISQTSDVKISQLMTSTPKMSPKKLSFKMEKSLVSTEESNKEVMKRNSINMLDSSELQFGLLKTVEKTGMKREPHLSDFFKGRSLGKGYFGEVFLVKHKQLGFVCAMKVISKQLVQKQRTSEQLLRQIKICLFVSHPNITHTYGFFLDHENLYILQQLMTDDQLFKILKRTRTFSEKQVAYLLNQILSALEYLHENHITHRDIKSENILMERGVAKVCDFGWAVYDPDDLRTSSIGTLLYLSPENIRGEGYDRRNDIWALGILTYEMLVGTVPFTIWGDDEKHKILSEEVKFSSFANVSDVAKDFILKMLQKDPDQRASLLQLQTHSFLVETGMMEKISLF